MCRSCKNCTAWAMTLCLSVCLAVSGHQHRRVLLPPLADAGRLGQDWPQAVCRTELSLPGLCQWRAMHCLALGVLQEGWRWPDLLLHGQHLWWLLRVMIQSRVGTSS